MAIRWDDFPHGQIRLKIHAKLNRNGADRARDDSVIHILRRRLAALNAEDHRRFVELQARDLVEHLRCTRDVYQEFVENQDCRPFLEAHWVVLRCAVFPTALDLLRKAVIGYAKITRVAGKDISLLFGIPTRTCYRPGIQGIAFLQAPDLKDNTPATHEELESLGRLVNDDTLLWFRDIRSGGGVGQPFGGGPFAIDDPIAMRNSFSLCGSKVGIDFPKWLKLRKAFWRDSKTWTEGLCSLFGSVQEELLTQWRALPSDSLIREVDREKEALRSKLVVVPEHPKLPQRLERGKDCEELAEEIATIKHKRIRSGLTMDEIRKDCPSLKIWDRVNVLSVEDKDIFLHPGMWETGYPHLLLGKLYANAGRDVAPGTIETWRKEYRKYKKWQAENPSEPPDVFAQQLTRIKRGYRKQLSQT